MWNFQLRGRLYSSGKGLSNNPRLIRGAGSLDGLYFTPSLIVLFVRKHHALPIGLLSTLR